MGRVSNGGAEAFGAGLAAMHRCTSEKFGWKRDNTIGATPQINKYTSGWVQFWREHRLGYQLQLARVNGHTGKLQVLGEKLMAKLDSFFPGPDPAASLLHGDLWSGNYSFDSAGQPVLFDPAVYYGDRETDIAMTELFGGFPAVFYAAYRESYPLDPGYDIRKTLYNLYHILNHLNLFGGGYRHQAEQMMGRLLAEHLRVLRGMRAEGHGLIARSQQFLGNSFAWLQFRTPADPHPMSSVLCGQEECRACPPFAEEFL